MIETEPDLIVCGEVQTEREARAAIRALAPDVVIVDISLTQGDGLEFVRDVHAQRPDPLSVKTIETHRQSLRRKLNLATNVQLLQYAIVSRSTPSTAAS
jgi:DNA-binding NarL/FixJ family response regulator